MDLDSIQDLLALRKTPDIKVGTLQATQRGRGKERPPRGQLAPHCLREKKLQKCFGVKNLKK